MEAGLLIALTLFAQELPLGGTRPNELRVIPDAAFPGCNCHWDFDPTVRTEPGQSYRATPMALAMRSPIYKAALKIANQDAGDVSGYCIRCHAPVGWLAGRSTPGDASALVDTDRNGITCDFCHRMEPDDPNNPTVGGGRYTISQSTSKRGPRDYQPNFHNISQSDYVGSSEMCGTCHSLFNPYVNHHDPEGRDLGIQYYEQRTYEEWLASDYATTDRKECIECHMGTAQGYTSSDLANEYSDMRVHSMVAGNLFMPRAVNLLEPTLGLNAELGALEDRSDEIMRSAATLEITTTHNASDLIPSGSTLELGVRVTNNTGHKLPTGYPEGRRVFIEVSVEITGRTPVILSGRWDPNTGDLDFDDDQLRTYDTGHGIDGVRSPHLILADQVLWDTRIPPKGYRPTEPDMVPFGRDYGSAPYRNYDEHTYQLEMPAGLQVPTGAVIRVRLLYMSFYGFYYDFLMTNIPSASEEAQNLRRVWESLGKAPPQEMASLEIPITLVKAEPVVPDAGPRPDFGVRPDAGEFEPPASGCTCTAHPQGSYALGWLLLALLPFVRRRR